MTRTDIKTNIVWLLWALFTMTICIWLVVSDFTRSVSLNYWLAGNHWLQGAALYNHTGTGFIYLPQSAVLYIPLALLPFPISEIAWRILSLGIFAGGLSSFCQTMSISNKLSLSSGFYFLLTTLIAIPLAFSSARNGQMHLLITGMVMFASAAVVQQQWWKIAVLLMLALALKTTAIVFVLLLSSLYWQVGWRSVLIGVALLFLPFLTQTPHYVLSQYSDALQNLRIAHNVGVHGDWAQLFSALAQWGWRVSEHAQTLARVIAAIAVWLLGYLLKRHCAVPTAIVWLFSLSMCYLMLFNPRTEGNDYIMLAPVLGFILATAIAKKQVFLSSLIVLCILILINGYYLAKAALPGHTAWVDPLVGVVITVISLVSIRLKDLTQEAQKTQRKDLKN